MLLYLVMHLQKKIHTNISDMIVLLILGLSLTLSVIEVCRMRRWNFDRCESGTHNVES